MNEMTSRIARWQNWEGDGFEHLALLEEPNGIVAEAAIVATVESEAFAIRYRIECDASWRVRRASISRIGDDKPIELTADGAGSWRDGNGIALPQLAGAIDIDISVTPFTNTLPLRRLRLGQGQSSEILVVYVPVPSLAMTTDRQRYTRLGKHRYRYESVDSDFTRDIEVDDSGLVTVYPGLFRRTM